MAFNRGGGGNSALHKGFSLIDKFFTPNSAYFSKGFITKPFPQFTKCAFTLAEVLITLGIIGVVAAITLPALSSKYQEKVTVNRLSQTYSLLSQAVNQMIVEHGQIQYWGDADERVEKFNELLPQYIGITKKCEKGSVQKLRNCMPWEYKYGTAGAPEEEIIYMSLIIPSFVLKNGVALQLRPTGTCQQDMTLEKKGCSEFDSSCSPHMFGTYLYDCGTIIVDINADSNPNKFDRDAFIFYLVQDGIVPAGSPKERVWTQKFDENCIKYQQLYGYGKCTAWVIYNKNMDYLHCPDKLGWNKASSCKK